MRYVATFLAVLTVVLATATVLPTAPAQNQTESAFIGADGEVYYIVDSNGNVVGA